MTSEINQNICSVFSFAQKFSFSPSEFNQNYKGIKINGVKERYIFETHVFTETHTYKNKHTRTKYTHVEKNCTHSTRHIHNIYTKNAQLINENISSANQGQRSSRRRLLTHGDQIKSSFVINTRGHENKQKVKNSVRTPQNHQHFCNRTVHTKFVIVYDFHTQEIVAALRHCMRVLLYSTENQWIPSTAMPKYKGKSFDISTKP